jgi:hypothetical protein
LWWPLPNRTDHDNGGNDIDHHQHPHVLVRRVDYDYIVALVNHVNAGQQHVDLYGAVVKLIEHHALDWPDDHGGTVHEHQRARNDFIDALADFYLGNEHRPDELKLDAVHVHDRLAAAARQLAEYRG